MIVQVWIKEKRSCLHATIYMVASLEVTAMLLDGYKAIVSLKQWDAQILAKRK
jgi:hypothetical protein